MDISAEIKEKIRDFVIEKNLKQSLDSLPNKGNYAVEFQYELAENKKAEKYIFVVSQKLTYHNHSVSDKRYGLYAFDRKTGNQIADFEKNGCYVGFFNDLKIVEEII